MERSSYNKPFAVFSVLLFVTFLAGSMLVSNFSFAENELDAPSGILSGCTMSRDYTVPHITTGLAGLYQENIGATTLKTVCNDNNGYSIYAIGSSNDEEGNTNLIGASTGTLIPTGIEFGDISNWSMKLTKVYSAYNPENVSVLDGYDEYHTVPSSWTKIATYDGATDENSGSVLKTSYAVRLSSMQDIDEYVGQVKYTMVHPATGMGPDMLSLQDVTMATCPDEPTPVYDKRDNEIYYIQKLGDGHCWMLDNLRLDGGSLVQTLSDANTNMPAGSTFTLPTTDTEQFNDYYNPNVNASFKDEYASYGDGEGKVGTFYNYCAASAGTICYYSGTLDAKYDICPKGWQMPSGGNSGDFKAIGTLYQSNKNAIKNALRIVGTGYLEDRGRVSLNTAIIWTTTNFNAWFMNIAKVESYYSPTERQNRRTGSSVRCILKPEETPKTYIQDVTLATCPTEPTVVYDKRDDEEYLINKLEDGNCWMLDNLRLDAAALKEPLSTDDTNMSPDVAFTLPQSARGFGSRTDPMVNTEYANFMVPYGNDAGEGKTGAFYNFCAASAGTVCSNASTNASYDICPKGWRLPKGNSLSKGGEWAAIYNTYTNKYGYPDGREKFATDLHAVRGGRYDSVGLSDERDMGLFWSSTKVFSNNIDIYLFRVYVNSVNEIDYNNREWGYSIRCIADNSGGSTPDPQPSVPHDMQDVTLATCPDEPTFVYDKRDGKAYKIAKLSDGKCWMLDNLSLGARSEIELTPADTNISSNFVLPASVNKDFNDYTKAQINIDSAVDEVSFVLGDAKIGTYYNFCAATAGAYCEPRGESVGEPNEDICPKGWRLPTGGMSGEYQTLLGEYATEEEFRDALRPTLSGYFKYNENHNQGTYGSFWSATPVGDDRMYSLDARLDAIHDDFTSYRTAGLSIRCVLK